MESPSASAAPAGQSFLGRHQFLIYRLFSLCGLLPIGGYLCVHLLTNATILDSPAKYQQAVNQIHSLGPILPAVEWVFIFIPILFHAAVGWMIIAGSEFNVSAYRYAANWRYTLQRATGAIAFFFILAHVLHLHHLGHFIGLGQFDPEHASSSAATALGRALWIQIFYAIGVVSASYHFANGLWTQGITWGVWISPAAQRRALYLSLFVGVGLSLAGLSALIKFGNQDIAAAQETENRLIQAQKLLRGELPIDRSQSMHDSPDDSDNGMANASANASLGRGDRQ